MVTRLLLARRMLVCASMCFTLGACTMVGAVPVERAQPTPGPRATTAVDDPSADPREPAAPDVRDASDAGRGVVASVVALARESIGTPYRWGGTDENGFDCSGLIQFAYAELGIPLPRTSADQIRSGAPVPTAPDALRPGDILGFSSGGGPKTEHVGLYLGDDQFIHSSSRGVRISSLRNRYWQDRLVAARRIVD